MLWTRDLDATIQFYTELLGLTCFAHEPDMGWASLGKDAVELMAAHPPEHFPFDGPAFTGSFYINVDDVDGLWDRVRELVQVSYPIESFDYGMREFGIYDNNGYLLQFGQEITDN